MLKPWKSSAGMSKQSAALKMQWHLQKQLIICVLLNKNFMETEIFKSKTSNKDRQYKKLSIFILAIVALLLIIRASSESRAMNHGATPANKHTHNFFLLSSSDSSWPLDDAFFHKFSSFPVPSASCEAREGTLFKTQKAIVTAYCPCRLCCGSSTLLTASGHRLKAGEKIIAAPPQIPFGTKIFVPGYGIATVQDRGGKIIGDRLDVYFDSHKEAVRWGKRNLKIKIINWKF